MKHLILLTMVIFLSLSCNSSTDDTTDEGQVLIIRDLTYIPSELTASAGETIIIQNEDDMSHTVTSESAEDAFDDSGDFDSGPIVGDSTGSITIPDDAVVGDQFFFYCDFHDGSMATPNGTITIE